MKRLSDIEKFKHIRFYVKFTDYDDSLLDGTLYMNTLGHFIDQEKESQIKGQGDRYEGAYVFGATNIQIIDSETDEVIATAPYGVYEERLEGIRETPVFCFTLFTAKDFKVIEETENSVSVMLDIGDEDKQKFLDNFGKKAVILPSNFVTLLKEDADEHELDFIIKSVSYHDYNVIDKKRREEYDKGSVGIVTWKDKFFEFQREMRFLIFNKPTTKPITFKMRSLRGLANVMEAEHFLSHCYIKLQVRQELVLEEE